MDLIHGAGIAQCLLLALYFFTKGKKAGNLTEAGLLSLLGFSIWIGYLYSSHEILEWPHLARLGFTAIALIGPLFLLSGRQRQSGNPEAAQEFTVPAWWFFLIPAGIFIYLIPFHLSPVENKIQYLKEDLVQVHFDCIVILYFSLANNLAAMVVSIYELYRADKSDWNRSSHMMKVYYAVPVLFLVVAAAISLFDTNILNSGLFSAAGSVIVILRSFILIYNHETGTSVDARLPQVSYQKSRLPASIVKEKGAQLETYLQNDEPYLEPDFSLAELARAIDLSPVQASQVLNRHFQMTFLQLVSKHRVDHACRLLKKYPPDYSVLDIALESGFNSKSAFHSAFRKWMDNSPSEYRKYQTNRTGA